MIGAVVQDYLEIDDRISGQETFLGCFEDAFLNGRDVGLRDGAAEDLVRELKTLTALERPHLDFAVAELPVTASLFLVPALDIGTAADRLAIRNLRRMKLDLDLIALLQFADDDFQVLLSVAGEQKLFGLRIAVEVERGIFLEDSMYRRAEAVFIVASLRFNRVGDSGYRHHRFRIGDRMGLVAERVARQGILELGDGGQITGVDRSDGLEFLAKDEADARETLGRSAVVVVHIVVVPQNAGNDFEITDSPGEGVRNGLVYEHRLRFTIGNRPACIPFSLAYAARRGSRREGSQEIEHRVGSDVVNRRGADDREDLLL